jgi:hypothetical protein
VLGRRADRPLSSQLKKSVDIGILLPSHTAGGRDDGVGKTTG